MIIDFVIPWVDGEDKEWRRKRDICINKDRAGIDKDDKRYRDWGLLKYWFRGVEKFSPWVNKIYFICDNQIPPWLNTEHSKLVIVDHIDFIPKEYLPTYNANPIELNMHRIKGLSEYFVYFNDDMFLTAPCNETDFFQNNLPCDLFVETPIWFPRDEVYNHIMVNDMALINTRFNRRSVLSEEKKKIYGCTNVSKLFQNIYMSIIKRPAFAGLECTHLCQPFLKSVFELVWHENYEWLDATSRNRFRSVTDVNQYVFKFYQLVLGRFTPYNWKKYGRAFQLADEEGKNGANIVEAYDAVINGKYKMICLNDAEVNNFDSVKMKLMSAFETLLPEKSVFEK